MFMQSAGPREFHLCHLCHMFDGKTRWKIWVLRHLMLFGVGTSCSGCACLKAFSQNPMSTFPVTPTRIIDLQKIWFCFARVRIILASLVAMAPCAVKKPGTKPYLTFGGFDGWILASSVLLRIRKGSATFSRLFDRWVLVFTVAFSTPPRRLRPFAVAPHSLQFITHPSLLICAPSWLILIQLECLVSVWPCLRNHGFCSAADAALTFGFCESSFWFIHTLFGITSLTCFFPQIAGSYRL